MESLLNWAIWTNSEMQRTFVGTNKSLVSVSLHSSCILLADQQSHRWSRATWPSRCRYSGASTNLDHVATEGLYEGDSIDKNSNPIDHFIFNHVLTPFGPPGRTIYRSTIRTISHNTSYQKLRVCKVPSARVKYKQATTYFHLHETCAVMAPPISGPIPLLQATAAPIKPLYLPRCCKVVISLANIITRAVLHYPLVFKL